MHTNARFKEAKSNQNVTYDSFLWLIAFNVAPRVYNITEAQPRIKECRREELLASLIWDR